MLKSLLVSLLSWGVFAAAAEVPVKIALNWKPEPQFGGFYEAAGKNLDLKEGVKLSLLEGGSGTPTVQMLANSKVDFAIVSAEEVLISNERNSKQPVVAVFAAYQTNPQMIMCHAEKGFKTLAEVFASPVTLAWQSGLTYAQFLKRKYPAAKAKFVPYLGGVTSFLADKNICQQGFATSEPLTAERAGAKVSAFLVSDEGFNPYTTVLAVRAETLAKQGELVAKVVRAVRAGWMSYVKDPRATNLAMHSLNKAMDAETFEKSATAQMPLIDPTGRMTAERWKELAATLASLKVIGPVRDVEKVFRNFAN